MALMVYRLLVGPLAEIVSSQDRFTCCSGRCWLDLSSWPFERLPRVHGRFISESFIGWVWAGGLGSHDVFRNVLERRYFGPARRDGGCGAFHPLCVRGQALLP